MQDANVGDDEVGEVGGADLFELEALVVCNRNVSVSCSYVAEAGLETLLVLRKDGLCLPSAGSERQFVMRGSIALTPASWASCNAYTLLS